MAGQKRTTSKNTQQIDVPRDFLNKLGEMHTGERELTIALPLVIAAAKSKDLKALLRLHLNETRGHVKAIDAIEKNLSQRLPTKGCPRITKLVGEAVKVIGKRLVTSEQDQELIACGQKIEQFEVDSYTGLCATAKANGFTHEFALLTSILNQEKIALELLGQLASGKGPIDKLVKKLSLKKAGAKSSSPVPKAN